MKFVCVNADEWVKTLTSYTKGGRARYWQCTPKTKVVSLDNCCENFQRVVTYYGQDLGEADVELNKNTILFSVTLNPSTHRVTVKEAVIQPDGKLYSDSNLGHDFDEARTLPLLKIVFGKDLYSWEFKFEAKLTSITKEAEEMVAVNSPHKDRFGVKIEVGDFISHPCDNCGVSAVDVHQVIAKDLTGERIAGRWDPTNLVVIKTSNPNKKLGW